MKKWIPNFFTLLNLLSGLIALFFVFQNNWIWVAIWVLFGILFDFFDGFLARKLKVSGQLGLELDSLADMVTSGVVPGFTMFFLIQNSLHIDLLQNFNFSFQNLWPFLSFSIPLASAYRLAVFNISEQKDTFTGLPTPANALFLISLPLIIFYSNYSQVSQFFSDKFVLSFIVILSSYLLNAKIQLFSLKFNDYTWKNNQEKYILILFSIFLLICLNLLALPLIIIIYILLSLFFKNNKSEITY